MGVKVVRTKHRFMTFMYRIQQTQYLISPVFWAATLTGVFFNIIRDYLVGRGIVTPSQVALSLLLIFGIIFTLILLAGFVYDVVLKLWREQNIVAVQRNPYSRERLMAKEIVLWKNVHLKTLQQVAKDDPEAASHIAFMERWIQKSLEGDPALRAEVEEIEAWVGKGLRERAEVLRP
jgi:predicted PurR-regulated permease PerM